ncbi:MAG TPA: hypothetical protein VKV22_09055 [Rhodanobacteraceae bacterium]|nr:hypothetical protein [Rhodanobacteraceae bacterium]
MKASNRLILSLTIGALVLQGCAETGGTRVDTGQVASVSTQTITPSASASKSTTAISEKDGKPVIAADTRDNFEAVAAAVRQEMQSGGRFAFVNKAGRETVDTKLTDMGALFERYGSVNKMDPAAQERLLADQNSINEVLARYDSNRRICWQETPVGTHFPRTVCRTLGEIQNQQNQSKQSLEMMRQLQQQQSQITNSPASGGGH